MWVGAVHLLSLTPTDPPTNTLTLYLYIIKISAWNSFIQLITNPNLMAHKLSKILYSSMKKDQEIKPKYDFFMTQQDRSKTTVTCEKWFDSSIDYYLNSLYILQTNMKKQQYIDLISKQILIENNEQTLWCMMKQSKGAVVHKKLFELNIWGRQEKRSVSTLMSRFISLDFNWLKLRRCVFTIIIINQLYMLMNSVLDFNNDN